MDLSVIQVGVIGVIGALLAVQLKGGRAEYGVYVSVAAGLVLFACILDRVEIFVESIRRIQAFADVEPEYLSILLKMIGVTYIAEFSSGVCRDAGNQSAAAQIQIFSRLTILILGLPVLLALLETIREFLL